ncbi:ABC transporter permease subunit [Galactobacter valiniphilus]|uniref:ABC transporter permease subunit n=1 Tax=Galactobacter valiniphilus TaxID=2676122 RepID=A0A399JBK1_9MICC|nr:ABC transporter permease subunit [Galactobacter valiniphilus]RII42430.1 ABC transporter permease subunit [Galactobacter valiniphilus]
MNLFAQALAWVFDPANWAGPDGLGIRLAEHLGYTALILAISAVVGIPLGYLVGHTGRGRNLVVLLSGAARALPSLGLVTLLALWLGLGLPAPVIAMVVLALPPILAGGYAGVDAVPRTVTDAAKAQGMSPLQVLTKVEAPLGLGLLMGGVRSATLQVVSTVMLAAYVSAGGLGRPLFLGLKTQDYPMMLGASLVTIALALALDVVLAGLQRWFARRGR